MTIATLDQLIASAKQRITQKKTGSRTTVANFWFTAFDLAGDPGAGTLAGTSTTAGVVPTDATTGVPIINAFGASATGYLMNVDFASNLACRMMIADVLFKAGAYSFNSNVTLSAQPSYASRVPDGDYSTTEIWIETVTAFTGNLSIAITYTNQDGATAHTTGTVATGVAPTLGRMIPIPLAAGDTGVQKIESVVASVATVGTFNVLVLRPLWTGRVPLAGGGDNHDYLRTGLPVVFADSALALFLNMDGTTSGVPEVTMTIANG